MDDVFLWREAPLPVRFFLFPWLAANVEAVINLVEGLSPRATAAAVAAEQERRHRELLELLQALYADQVGLIQAAPPLGLRTTSS
jgi:hypothetical protein